MAIPNPNIQFWQQHYPYMGFEDWRMYFGRFLNINSVVYVEGERAEGSDKEIFDRFTKLIHLHQDLARNGAETHRAYYWSCVLAAELLARGIKHPDFNVLNAIIR